MISAEHDRRHRGIAQACLMPNLTNSPAHERQARGEVHAAESHDSSGDRCRLSRRSGSGRSGGSTKRAHLSGDDRVDACHLPRIDRQTGSHPCRS